MDKSSYSLCFKGCTEIANQSEARKIQIIIVNVVSHEDTHGRITLNFSDNISCQMARDILGECDWEFISETEIVGTWIRGIGYKIQNHYFKMLTVQQDSPDTD